MRRARTESPPRAVLPDAMRRNIVSGRLSLAIARSGMSAKELAERSGIAHSSISRYARGERMVTTFALIALCPLLGVAADWVLGLDPPTAERLAGLFNRKERPRKGKTEGADET